MRIGRVLLVFTLALFIDSDAFRETAAQCIPLNPFKAADNIRHDVFATALEVSRDFFNEPLDLPRQLQNAVAVAFGVRRDMIASADSFREDIFSKTGTPLDFLITGVNLVAGFPFELLSSMVNRMCSTALASGTIQSKMRPNINRMRFQLRSPCYKYSYPLRKADEMRNNPEFDATKQVVVVASGWTTTVNRTETIDGLAKAYNCRGDVNFIAIDAANYVNTLYVWAAQNTEGIGRHIAEGLERLVRVVPVENLHLIGHSLGAHIMGAAARHFREITGKNIPRVTGLDPAKPCFNKGEKLAGLSRGDADFVDVIHTNPGILGKRDSIGDVDFYPGGLAPLARGCLDIFCSHERSWQFYAESVYPGSEDNFLATRCVSLTNLRVRTCTNTPQRMGYKASPELRGNYFLEVNPQEPFGINAATDFQNSCGICGLCTEP